jgi:hypothetical protein
MSVGIKNGRLLPKIYGKRIKYKNKYAYIYEAVYEGIPTQ